MIVRYAYQCGIVGLTIGSALGILLFPRINYYIIVITPASFFLAALLSAEYVIGHGSKEIKKSQIALCALSSAALMKFLLLSFFSIPYFSVENFIPFFGNLLYFWMMSMLILGALIGPLFYVICRGVYLTDKDQEDRL